MWCSSCRADVAAELSTDNRRMLCARCQSELGIAATATPATVNAPRMVETERDARELLARWSTQNLLETNSPVLTNSASTNTASKPGNGRGSHLERTQVRFDPPSTTPPLASGPFVAAANDARASNAFGTSDESIHRDSLHPPGPKRNMSQRDPSSFDPAVLSTNQPQMAVSNTARVESDQDQDRLIRDALQKQLNRRLGWSTFAGQLFAYGGVGALTCGTVLVTWSHFGGPPNYLPTGLLTAAVGQMLLFLGVVSLISSGMEQTVHEVSWRIDHLAEEIYHLGVVIDDLESHHRSGVHPPAPGVPSQISPNDGISRKAA